MRNDRWDYALHLDREGAEWLAEEAESLFRKTRDHGWEEIAAVLRKQLVEGQR